ncbi:MAG TPA: hypothetical protein VJQ56_03745, partial [Blastocatellia bacterium]|nr:hypothetical protein [Blastocatellia bacterium]
LLATVQETRGERAAAESSLREAVRLAPNYTTTRWRLANLLLRIGKPREALDEFNRVVISNRRYLPAALDLIWSASSGSVEAVKEVVRGDAQSQISLAVFLLRQSRLSEAVEIFANAERSARLASTDTPGFLNSLIEKGRAEQARDLWLGLVSEESDRPVVWNGSFESDPVQSFPQFDWAITRTNYARPVIDRTTARTGARSLKIEFAGRDTTKLDREVWQMLALKPGARYELECFVKANDFVTPEGPRIVISGSSTDEIASSAPIAAGTYEWRRVVFEFIAPPAGIVHISIKRTPRFSYDEPTQGTLWIDDIRAIGR